MKQLFISDLHLWEQQPELEKLFHHFMEQQASSADELYVLGDLFEVWVGDDAIDAMAERVINSFSHFSQNGGKLYFMHGNRDFLLGNDFIKATGGTLLEEPHQMELAGENALLMHGDSLCLEDKEYIEFRKMVRSTQWQKQVLSQSVEQRLKIARELREGSTARGQAMSEKIADVTNDEVINVMTKVGVTLLIHGHTHRQARHPLTINDKPAERIVLGDWGVTGSVLTIDNHKVGLSNFSL